MVGLGKIQSYVSTRWTIDVWVANTTHASELKLQSLRSRQKSGWWSLHLTFLQSLPPHPTHTSTPHPHSTAGLWRSVGNLQELALSFHLIGPPESPQVVRLASKHLNPQRHCTGLKPCFQNRQWSNCFPAPLTQPYQDHCNLCAEHKNSPREGPSCSFPRKFSTQLPSSSVVFLLWLYFPAINTWSIPSTRHGYMYIPLLQPVLLG